MGTCFGRFKKRNKIKRHVRLHRCFYFHDKDKVEFELLVNGEPKSSTEFITEVPDVWFPTERPSSSLLSKQEQKSVLKKWADENGGNHSLDKEATQLLPLDAHSLLASRVFHSRKISWSSSTPPSSIDLEWENEGGITNSIPRLKSQRSLSSNIEETSSGCVGGGSPESLEWDPGTDGETEQLISEIERLTSRALKETGDWGSTTANPL